ncbi:MAG: hypothetical protein IGR93_22545 [Hydrococcus sp. C42_A2020_068]|nr:hypothetical protein [Hydrococcus sp. C42_A2020_068]
MQLRTRMRHLRAHHLSVRRSVGEPTVGVVIRNSQRVLDKRRKASNGNN